MPPEPTEYSNEGAITGNQGSLELVGKAKKTDSEGNVTSVGQIKRYKIRFRGYNSRGYGITSDPFEYTQDLR